MNLIVSLSVALGLLVLRWGSEPLATTAATSAPPSWVGAVVVWLTSAWYCADRARQRGYGPGPFILAGLLLGPGGYLLTRAFTQERRVARPGWEERTLAGEEARGDLALARYLAWEQDYHDVRLACLRSFLLGQMHLVVVPLACMKWILPTFVTLFEGMSLKLPWPTEAVIWLSTYGASAKMAHDLKA